MSLLSAIKAHYEEENSPPEGPDLDYVKVGDGWVVGDTVTRLVSSEDSDNARWGTWFTNVYERDGVFVAVTDCRPATEYQSWGDYGPPEIEPVREVTETIVVKKYLPLKD